MVFRMITDSCDEGVVLQFYCNMFDCSVYVFVYAFLWYVVLTKMATPPATPVGSSACVVYCVYLMYACGVLVSCMVIMSMSCFCLKSFVVRSFYH